MDFILKNFFNVRHLYTCSNSIDIYSLLHGLNFSGWNFFISRSNVFKGIISYDNLKNYKRKIKSILKAAFSERFFLTLKKLNSFIYNWNNLYSCADSNKDISGILDVYLSKLLWNWARRRHPRRPSTWIYNKYWKFVPLQNVWNFHFVDYNLGKCIFLNMHVSRLKKVYCLPMSMNVFSLKNYNKVGLSSLKKYSQFLNSLILVLYKFQSGKCFSCRSFFTTISLNMVKIAKTKHLDNGLITYVLVHSNCSVLPLI